MTPPLLSQAHLGGIALVEELLDGHLEGPPGEAQHARDPPVVLRLFERLPRRLWVSARVVSPSVVRFRFVLPVWRETPTAGPSALAGLDISTFMYVCMYVCIDR